MTHESETSIIRTRTHRSRCTGIHRRVHVGLPVLEDLSHKSVSEVSRSWRATCRISAMHTYKCDLRVQICALVRDLFPDGMAVSYRLLATQLL